MVKIPTVRTNSAGAPGSPSQNEGLLALLDKPEDSATDGPLTGAGLTKVKGISEVMDFVVTVDNVDFDLIGKLERAVVFEDKVDQEVLLGAEAVVRPDGSDKSHG